MILMFCYFFAVHATSEVWLATKESYYKLLTLLYILPLYFVFFSNCMFYCPLAKYIARPTLIVHNSIMCNFLAIAVFLNSNWKLECIELVLF